MMYKVSFLSPAQKRKIDFVRANTEIDPAGQDDEWIAEILEAFGNCEKQVVSVWKDAVAKADQAMEDVFQKWFGHIPAPFSEHCLNYYDSVEEADTAWKKMDRESAKAFSKVLNETFFVHLDSNPHSVQNPQNIN